MAHVLIRLRLTLSAQDSTWVSLELGEEYTIEFLYAKLIDWQVEWSSGKTVEQPASKKDMLLVDTNITRRRKG